MRARHLISPEAAGTDLIPLSLSHDHGFQEKTAPKGENFGGLAIDPLRYRGLCMCFKVWSRNNVTGRGHMATIHRSGAPCIHFETDIQ